MSSMRAWCLRLTGLFDKERKDGELSAELESHLQMHIEDNLRAGMSPAEARRNALLSLGGMEQTKEKCRNRRSIPVLESLLQDVRFGARMLRKSPGFTTVAILTLALGIGANTVVFSVIDRVLFNLFPFIQPQQLVAIYQRDPEIPKSSISYPNFLDLQRENHTFQAMAVWRHSGFTLASTGESEHLWGKMISANYFSVLGIAPILGRTFLPEEDQLGAPHVVLIGESFWRNRFAADRNVQGATLTLDGKLYTVVGVMPSFRVLRNLDGSEGFFDDVYVPIGQWENKVLRDRDSGPGTIGYGRLRAGVTLAQARADTDQIAKSLEAVDANMKGIGISIVPLREDTVGEIQRTLWMLFAAVGFVVLIACANIANLLLARSSIRTREFAVRAALGATRFRIVQQSLTEGILLSCAGGGAATALAALGTRSVLQVLPSTLPGASLVGLNTRVLFFALGLSILTGILFASVPALKLSRANLQGGLKESGRSLVRGRHRAQAFFIVGQIALALVLLVGAGLMIRSLALLWGVNPGFDRHNSLSFSVTLPPPNGANPARTLATLHRIDDRIKSVPGVESATLSLAAFPFADVWTTVSWPAGRPKPASIGEWYPIMFFAVGSDYFEVMRIPLLRGRQFTSQDDNSAPTVALVDEEFAKTVFGNENPVGKRVFFQRDSEAEIVGVVSHVKTGSLDNDVSVGWVQIRSQLYLPYPQLPSDELPVGNVDAVVRSTVPAATLLPSIRKAVSELDSSYVIHHPRTVDDLVDRSLAQRRFSMFLLSAFAAIALLLAIIGIYGVISYSVTERTQELGIRLALGARPGDVQRMVIGAGLKLAFIGVGIGVAGALALTRFLSSLLFGVSPSDPLTFAGVALLLVAVSLLACYIPARRAAKVDPMVALRYE